jgi:hypothetical protein
MRIIISSEFLYKFCQLCKYIEYKYLFLKSYDFFRGFGLSLFSHEWNVWVIYTLIKPVLYPHYTLFIPSLYSYYTLGGMFWLFIVGLFCYIYIFYYLCVDSLMPLAVLHFCVGLDFVTPSL